MILKNSPHAFVTEKNLKGGLKMRFIMTGFKQDMEFRVFAFERVSNDRVSTEFTVRADLSLVRKHDIKMQELPLLCRSFLERREAGDEAHSLTFEAHSLTFSEEEMLVYARDRAVARLAAQKRRPVRKPSVENHGTAWRSPRPL